MQAMRLSSVVAVRTGQDVHCDPFSLSEESVVRLPLGQFLDADPLTELRKSCRPASPPLG